MKINLSIDAALIITITTTFLYMVGQVYLSTYLNFVGADITVMNFSIQDKVYYGYIRAIQDTGYIILFFLLFLGAPFLLKKTGTTSILINILIKIKNKIRPQRHIPPIHRTTKQTLNQQNFLNQLRLIYITLMMFFGSLTYLVYITQTTELEVANDIKQYDQTLQKVQVRNNSDKETYLILCGASLCTILFTDEQPYHVRFIDPKNVFFIVKNQSN